ncbi:unnamed protein product [Rotaria magnacalcarata]|uniref:BEACH domain-containing protein n=2 Tax=Rotaria magnacalcarata TaxID=392030 RepID=A0A819MMA6_9BILA|nr:unnamed protein product [Rotaria magnacalcarata]
MVGTFNTVRVMHYLIRMEPFTTLNMRLQSGKIDIADRQFHSFQSAWLNIMDSPNEVKELIPEFFYSSEFLINSNKFDLGKLRVHRLALESDYVSAHLHQWIDLIFVYKQAVDADPIEDPVTREAIEGMIQNFGQIPSKLLTEPHPPRQTREQTAFEIELQDRVLNIFQNLTHTRAFCC